MGEPKDTPESLIRSLICGEDGPVHPAAECGQCEQVERYAARIRALVDSAREEGRRAGFEQGLRKADQSAGLDARRDLLWEQHGIPPAGEPRTPSPRVEEDPPDCGDNSCRYAKSKGGMRTNGGCRCDNCPECGRGIRPGMPVGHRDWCTQSRWVPRHYPAKGQP